MFEPKLLDDYISQGLVRKQIHPSENLIIYNYTPKTQYDKVWDDITLNCRGLILGSNGRIISRPFKKFFNLGESENQNIPNEPFEVFEKLDGSLGIIYWYEDKPYIATRGSFTSQQAMKATDILYKKYSKLINDLNKKYTYLFEIIYPENRIVVDYGKQEDIILIGIIENESGDEIKLQDIGFPVVNIIDGIKNIESLKNEKKDNKEGFVIKFKSGLRYKVKFEEYLRIHRIVTNVSNISIWEYLKTGKDFDEILDRVPDEFYNWVSNTKNDIIEEYYNIENECKKNFKVLNGRKDTALYFQKQKYSNVLFSMLDNKNYSEIIWKLIRPTFSKPFKEEN